MMGLSEHWYGLSVAGPIAWSVKDAALMFDVLAGTNQYRDVSFPTKNLRIAVSTKTPTALATLAPEIKEAVNACAATLRDAGHSVSEADPPYPVSLPNHVLRLWLAGVAQDSQKLDWRGLEKRTRTMVRLGRRFGPASPTVLARWATQASTWFREFDVALTPCVARSSIPAGGWTGRGFVSTALSQIRALPYTQAWNVAGFPAASVPAGIGPGGVPLSVQVVAPAGAEALVLSVAAQIENLRPWPRFSAERSGAASI
jgi:amidase